jgi:SAM-dependent methyltransferase
MASRKEHHDQIATCHVMTGRRSRLGGAEWRDTDRAEEWPSLRQQLPHIADAEAMLVEHLIPMQVGRILDLGTGDGHLIRLLRDRWPGASAVGLDLSPEMLAAAQERFATTGVRLEVHDLMRPLPESLGRFDVVVSALAIHHLPDSRKRALFAEVFALLTEGGVFFDLDCVLSASPELHALSQVAFGLDERGEDPSDQPASLNDQLMWLRETGFEDVDCFWKWMELSLVGGRRPRGTSAV